MPQRIESSSTDRLGRIGGYAGFGGAASPDRGTDVGSSPERVRVGPAMPAPPSIRALRERRAAGGGDCPRRASPSASRRRLPRLPPSQPPPPARCRRSLGCLHRRCRLLAPAAQRSLLVRRQQVERPRPLPRLAPASARSRRRPRIASPSALSSQETSLQETSLQETSVQETSLQETASQETSLQETSLQETASQETSLQDTSVQETASNTVVPSADRPQEPVEGLVRVRRVRRGEHRLHGVHLTDTARACCAACGTGASTPHQCALDLIRRPARVPRQA